MPQSGAVRNRQQIAAFFTRFAKAQGPSQSRGRANAPVIGGL